MSMPDLDRREKRRFRLLYMSMQAFIDRFILRRRKSAAARPPTSSGPTPATSPSAAPQWKSGVPRMDEQQEAMFEAIRTLQAAIKAGARSEGITNVLAFLEPYTEEHFLLEESYMEHLHYPDSAAHHEEHRMFRHRVQEFRQRSPAGDSNLSLELLNVLHDWLREHVMKEDVACAEFAKAKRRGPAARQP